MTNKFPEADSETSFNFAPAEGKIPASILKDADWDINSFPNLHPTGQNKMFQDRKRKLTPQQYLVQRLRNKDTRFEQCTPYVFAAAAYLEEKQMERNIGVSFSKGKVSVSDNGNKSYKLEDAYSVLDDVKGTPKYWKKNKMEMLAKIDNFGPFHWFYTLSCADMRWNENFSSILREKGYKIIWKKDKESEESRVDNVKVFVEFRKEGELDEKILENFLKEECDDSLHEFIRTNVFIATRNFIQRVKAFRYEIMMGTNNPLALTNFCDKMEFQGRGAGHIHGVAWSNLKKVSKLIEEEKKAGIILSKKHNETEDDVEIGDNKENDESEYEDNDKTEDTENISYLESAYRKLRENKPLIEAEEHVLIDFVDRAVTCTLNPDMAAKMIDINMDRKEGLKIIEIVQDCLKHHHTKACRKHGGTCRFRFPRFPMWQTILSKSVDEDDTEKKSEKMKKHKEVLEKVMVLLEDDDKVANIMNEYDKSIESIDDYRNNRKKRIMQILELAGVSSEEYLVVLKESTKKGIDETLINYISTTTTQNGLEHGMEI